VGGGDTGLQVASIFNAFGTRVQLFQAAPRIIPAADESVAAEVAGALRKSGIEIREQFGTITSFEKTAGGVRMNFSGHGASAAAEAALVVVAVGWIANTKALNLPAAGVELNQRGFIKVDEYLQSSAPQVLAAGDATGQLMLMPQALQQGFVAATNAVHGPRSAYTSEINPVGSFTDPEYAQVGLTEAEARQAHDSFSVVVRFDCVTRTIIDGRTTGFCKLLVDRATHRLLGCHVVGERAVELVQLAATAMAGGLRVQDLARIPMALPTYAGILTRASAIAARECVPGLEGLSTAQ
jgi:pyruvate/2-oxoglutarate dehydrogenase complex dihydrolipoamide dehydrogenase (E3) component